VIRAMGLKTYKEKSDFPKTPERGGEAGQKSRGKKGGLVYVVQRHQASRPHFDLRLEEAGVLRSWAVSKEPPLQEGVRRLAVQVEDHPLAYAGFQGTIPQGEYGAGTVEIWDQGSYRPEETTPVKRVFEIQGHVLRGRYCLIKLKSQNPDDHNWLFFKLKKGPA
jgi:bifunctional non-homologous end joining protein LigD